MIKLVYWDINNSDFSEEKYISFLKQYYRDDKETQQRFKRVKWYNKCPDYKILLAVLNNEIVGQTSAYRCTAIIKGKEEEWWWSVDTFVLPKMRGKGIGKKLQNKFHQDLQNFSSLWYSPSNGIIKKKCGANEIATIDFNYYPISNYFHFIFNLILKRFINSSVNIKFQNHYFYYYINKLRNKKYNIEEIIFPNSKYEKFINECLKQYDIYIKRDNEYLTWKYINNPSLNYNSLAIYDIKNRNLIGIVAFSNVYNKNLYGQEMKVISILDVFIKPKSCLYYKEVFCYIIQFYKNKKMYIDGIISLQDTNYYPKFIYPLKGSFLLSTNKTICKNPYFAYSDQDMEQMI